MEGEKGQTCPYSQAAVRWYGSVLGKRDKGRYVREPLATDVGSYRKSSDVSVDRAIGNAIAKEKRAQFERLSEEERRMLFWYMKNTEYALGANLRDLSMKFWDIDERHAFEGDHVLLREGYSAVVGYVLQQLLRRGKRFRYELNFPVGRIEYARKTTSQTYTGSAKRLHLVDLSDTCCVTSSDGKKSVKSDFAVCAVPLGVLKEAVSSEDEQDNNSNKIEFSPVLPFVKRDAIQSVGFGLLNKVYLQFPSPFWRTGTCRLGDVQALFGNASSVHPHHYMFFDMGKILGRPSNEPAILMSLISGKEAVKCEFLTEDALVEEAMETLRALFSAILVPDPIAVKTTRWGKDEFSRGSYTFLPPGSTDQDFHCLQSPINGNGDLILLEGPETMRLFFAGEHTTALHPSMAHGAMLSGIRAGTEVLSAFSVDTKDDSGVDKLIPLSVFRFMNPDASLDCAFCHEAGSRAYEGPLLAFKHGSRQMLAHNCCAEYSPEVEVDDGVWKNVLKAVNRSASLKCLSCGKSGASIGCNDEHCQSVYHFRCAEQTNWNFENDGKEFYCEVHRPEGAGTGTSSLNPAANGEEGVRHALFSSLSGDEPNDDKNTNDDNGPRPSPSNAAESVRAPGSETAAAFDTIGRLTSDLGPEQQSLGTRLIRLRRPSLKDRWNIKLESKPLPGGSGRKLAIQSALTIASAKCDDPFEPFVKGDIILSINGEKIGSAELDSVHKVVARLGQEVDVMMEVQSPPDGEDSDDQLDYEGNEVEE